MLRHEKNSVQSFSSKEPHLVVTDLTVSSSIDLFPKCNLDQHGWYRVPKNLFVSKSEQQTWLYVQRRWESDLEAGDQVVMDIKVGAAWPDSTWESRPGGIWILRRKFSGKIDEAVTAVDVLFGTDAVDPRPQWTLMDSALDLENASSEIPTTTLTICRGRTKTRPDNSILRVRKNGSFKIVQISDMHMGTGAGVCKDAVGANGEHLPESEADPLTMNLVRRFLDAEKPDLVVLTGDQLHHDIPDSQSALFKAVAPLIERSIPFAVVFGNHDSEGIHALSRTEQMSILQSLPFSLSQPGPEDVDGIGNYYLEILAHHPPQLPLATLYLLDSHGQIPNNTSSPGPDYSPIQKSQMDWFSSTSQALRDGRKKKGDINPFHLTMAFFHIPLPEFGDSTLKMYSGRRREPTEGPKMNSHFFKTLQQENILAVGTGHDHVNDFCALLPKLNDEKALGPWLCQGGSSGFGGYCSYNKKRYPRRMRGWQLNATHGSLKTWTRTEHGSDPVDDLVLVQNGMVTMRCQL